MRGWKFQVQNIISEQDGHLFTRVQRDFYNSRINEINIIFQNQGLEIQNAKLEIHWGFKDLCCLFIRSETIPNDFSTIDVGEWKDVDKFPPKFVNSNDFISNLITGIDIKLVRMSKLKRTMTKNNHFQMYFNLFWQANFINKIISYFPFANKIINCLDFVTLQSEFSDLKKKI